MSVSHLDRVQRHTLGVRASTAVCGNDIASSCLYASALCAAQAGVFAPLALLVVARSLCDRVLAAKR